jgi:hypothetical protein
MYEYHFKIKKTEKAEHALLQNNGEDVKLSENKVSHKCEILKDKVLAITEKFEGFSQNKKIKGRPSVERK